MNSRRKSKKREAIYQALCAAEGHPTAESLYASLKPEIPDLSLGTVYRNLALFKEEGLAVSAAVIDGQEHFDACNHPHAHFICRVCGEITDMGDIPPLAPPDSGAQVESVQLYYRGVCGKCAEGQQRS